MADVTGPISTLPGAIHAVPEGAMCDCHGNRPVYRRVQGETDSFGSEMLDFCKEGFDQHKKDVAEADTSGCCDWCKTWAPKLRNRRDFDEGSSGPVYQVCDPCIRKENERLAEELEDDDDYYNGYL